MTDKKKKSEIGTQRDIQVDRLEKCQRRQYLFQKQIHGGRKMFRCSHSQPRHLHLAPRV